MHSITRTPAFQLLLRLGEEFRRHGVGGAIPSGRRSVARYPRERDSLAVRPFAGTRARLGTFTVPTPATDSTPPQATPAGEPSPGDSITNVSARPRAEVASSAVRASF